MTMVAAKINFLFSEGLLFSEGFKIHESSENIRDH